MEFKKWFYSENVLTLYHGSRSEGKFSQFKMSGEENKWGPGAYFAYEINGAQGWGNKIYKVELTVDKPYRSDLFLTPKLFDEITVAANKINKVPPPLAFRNDKNGYSFYQVLTKVNGYSKKDANEILIAAGFDAIVDGTSEVVALIPDKIKLINVI